MIIELDSAAAGDIEVWVDPDADYYDRVYPVILDAQKQTEVAETAINQIKLAMNRAGNSSYLLLGLGCLTYLDYFLESHDYLLILLFWRCLSIL